MPPKVYTFVGMIGIIYVLFFQGVVTTSSDVDQVVYVYEKDEGPVPRPVAGALMEINLNESLEIEATEFEDDTVNPDGEIPDQYAGAAEQIEDSQKTDIPRLVVLADGEVVKIIKGSKEKPITYEQVMESIGN